MPQKFRNISVFNFCAICEVQNADNVSTFTIWPPDKLHEMSAPNKIVIVRR